jgi:2-octaprenyl-6-methoxyphenol hydroxylase
MRVDQTMLEDRVLVCGAGPAGASFALLIDELSAGQQRPLLLDARSLADARADRRLIAVSEGSRVLLRRVGAWSDDLGTPIHRIHVSRRGAFGRCLIDRDDYQQEALGWVVEYGALVGQLNAALQARGIEVLRPRRVLDTECAPEESQVSLDDGQRLSARFIVHAEGTQFAAARTDNRAHDYQQTALTAFVTCALPQPNLAWERFTDSGPLALLPARRDGRDGLYLVWCCAPDKAQRLAQLADEEFLVALWQEFGDRLGRFASVGGRQMFPLALQAVADPAREREFAIGNAAQSLHPVAGQGLNLGLRDAFTLARLMSEAGVDAARLCSDYRRARRRDRAATVNLTDALARVFVPRALPLSLMRTAALTFLDMVPAARGILARQMMDGQR